MIKSFGMPEFSSSDQGKTFEFTFTDGEVTVGKLLEVNVRSGEFIYEMSATNEPTRYRNPHGKYSALFTDLTDARLLDVE